MERKSEDQKSELLDIPKIILSPGDERMLIHLEEMNGDYCLIEIGEDAIDLFEKYNDRDIKQFFPDFEPTENTNYCVMTREEWTDFIDGTEELEYYY